MSVPITCKYLGNKKTLLIHGPSGRELQTAAPLDNQGDGSSFSPTDLSASSLLSCVITTMAIYAERNGIDLSGTHGRIEKHMNADPRRIGKLPAQIHLPRSLPPQQREVLQRVALTCPVHRSLNPEVEINLDFTYDV